MPAVKSANRYPTTDRLKKKRVQVGQDLRIDFKNHEKLLGHIKERAEWANDVRTILADHFNYLDRQLFGFIKLDEDDKRREQDNVKGFPPQPTDVNIQFIWSQIDDAVTDLLAIILPDGGTYGAITNEAQQDEAQGLARKMNNDSAEFMHYDNYAIAAFHMFSKNFGGVIVEWEEKYGNTMKKGATGQVITEKGVAFAGNSVTAIDPYNTLLDPTVDPVKLYSEGEFFITVEKHTPFRVKKMEMDKEIFSAAEHADETTSNDMLLYREKPSMELSSGALEVSESFDEILSMSYGTHDFNLGHEFWHFYGHITPADFGLSGSKELEIWHIVVMNGRYIVKAEPLLNNHGFLPIAIGMPCRSGLGIFEPSYGAKLLPLQRFASFSVNIHQKATRKALYGLTFYDATMAPFMDLADPLGGKIPVKLSGMDKDIRKMIHQINDVPSTDRTLDNVNATDAIMQKILPTDILKQVASLERATTYQAAATVQAANRRSYKNAKLLDSQIFRPTRVMQFYNLVQRGSEIAYIDDDGQEKMLPVANLIEKFNPDSLASDSLRGIDKLVIIENMREIINMSIQSREAFQSIDILKMIDYMATLLGDKTDYNQFRVKSQIDSLSPELKDQAFALLQQALAQQEGGGGGNGLQGAGAGGAGGGAAQQLQLAAGGGGGL